MEHIKGYAAFKESLNNINEGLFKNIMKGLKDTKGPWSVVVSTKKDGVIHQETSNIPDVIPAIYREATKKFPGAFVVIEASTGQRVYLQKKNESLNEAKVVALDKNQHDLLIKLTKDAINRREFTLGILDDAEQSLSNKLSEYAKRTGRGDKDILTSLIADGYLKVYRASSGNRNGESDLRISLVPGKSKKYLKLFGNSTNESLIGESANEASVDIDGKNISFGLLSESLNEAKFYRLPKDDGYAMANLKKSVDFIASKYEHGDDYDPNIMKTIEGFIKDIKKSAKSFNSVDDVKSTIYESIVNEGYSSVRDADDIFFIWDEHIDDDREGIEHGTIKSNGETSSSFDFDDSVKGFSKFEKATKSLIKKNKWEYEWDGSSLYIYE
jgi:hypothetical protein